MTGARVRSIHIQGAGKVGRALASSLRKAGWRVTLRAARRGAPKTVRADVVVFAVRDGDVEAMARTWAESVRLGSATVVLHVAGALGPQVLGAVRPGCGGIGVMHPLLSIASPRRVPAFEGGHALVDGTPEGVRAAMVVARAVGMSPHHVRGVDREAYHAAAGLLAGGAAALALASRDLLTKAGLGERLAERMLASLLASVAVNIGALGLPAALTGVVRRGDVSTLVRHGDAIGRTAPEHLALYLALVQAQVPMAQRIGDAPGRAVLEMSEKIAAMQRRRC